MRVTLVANTDWYLFNFRSELAHALREADHEVSLVCPDGRYVPCLRKAGFDVHTFAAPREGFSLAGNARALGGIAAAFRELRPDLVHLFTPVCVLLGAIAARRCRVRYRVAALTGLGHVFTSGSAKARVARPALRWLFRRELRRPGVAVIVQNVSDRDDLVDAEIVPAARCHLVRGSGVDTVKFSPGSGARGRDEVRILFASRLLREKGLEELLAAFALVHDRMPQARLWVAGDVYPPNPSSFTEAEVLGWSRRPGVEVLGHVDDMPGLLARVDAVALPSWREGTPKILLEAAACGLPVVATDIPGCRGVVEDGRSGYLVPAKRVEPLAGRLGELVGDAALRERFGRRGRAIVVDGFSMERVVEGTFGVYRALAGRSFSAGPGS